MGDETLDARQIARRVSREPPLMNKAYTSGERDLWCRPTVGILWAELNSADTPGRRQEPQGSSAHKRIVVRGRAPHPAKRSALRSRARLSIRLADD
jgi:hypothetical protein